MSHNHPSGSLKSSNSDIEISVKVKNALDLFDINMLDQLIITDDSYYSLADEGLL